MTTEELTKDTIEHGRVVPIIEDPTLDVIKRHLPGNYTNIGPFREGGTRKVYKVKWGPNGKERVIKVDKKPSTIHAARNVDRGYTTAREVQVASGIDEPGEHHLIRLYDYMHIPELAQIGFSDVASIEEYFPNQTLEDRVKERGVLNAKEFEQVFRGVLDAERYLIKDQGLLHRDLNRKNILIKQNGKLDVRVADLTNACSINEVTPKSRPTSGSRFVLDPTTEEIFTENPLPYSERSEIYAIGKNMLFALTGEDAVAYDPDQGTATDLATGESLLNSGRLNISRHDQAITSILLKKLPKKSRQYYYMMRRALSLSDHMRYKSIDELVADFEKASKPTLWERVKKNKAVTATITAGFLTLGSIFGAFSINQANKNKDLQSQVEFEKKNHVVTGWDGSPFEVSNNVVELLPKFYKYNDRENSFPEDKFITANPGQEISYYISAKELPRREIGDEWSHSSAPHLRGKVYIEGYPGNLFWTDPTPVNTTHTFESHAIYGAMGRIEIPKDAAPGNYTIAVELYGRDNDSTLSDQEKDFVFENPGKVISRKRIPLIVGNVDEEKRININSVTLDYPRDDVNFETVTNEDFGGFVPHHVKYEYYSPELGVNPFSREYAIDSTKNRDTSEVTLQVNARDTLNNWLGTYYVPLKREIKEYPNGYVSRKWTFPNPDSSWSDKLIAYRKALQGDSSGLFDIREQLREEEQARTDSIRVADSLLEAAKMTAFTGGRGGYYPSRPKFDWRKYQEEQKSKLDSTQRAYDSTVAQMKGLR